MRNKKTFLSLGLFVLVLFLGVGYAVVSSVYFKAKGTASVNDSQLNVEITDAVASTTVADKAVNFNHVLSNNNLTSNFTLNGLELNETVSITYTVTNNETDVDAFLSEVNSIFLTASNSDYFNVYHSITDSYTDIKNNDKTMTVVVYVRLFKTPVTEENSSTNISLSLVANPSNVTSNSIVENTNLDSPIYLGEKYYFTIMFGADAKQYGNYCITFYEDGHLEKCENSFSLSPSEGYTYTRTQLVNPSSDYIYLLSSDGKHITVYDGNAVIISLAVESEFNRLKNYPIIFAKKYVCTTDNSNSGVSNIGSYAIFYPDGSARIYYSDGDKENYSAGSLAYTETEIKADFLSDNLKMIVSSDGTTITQLYNDQVIYVYTLES